MAGKLNEKLCEPEDTVSSGNTEASGTAERSQPGSQLEQFTG